MPIAPHARPHEDALQKQIVEYLRAIVPDHVVFAVPNAAQRTRSGRAGNAVPGLLPGIPDLMILAQGGRAYLIEVKTARGIVSDVQREVLTLLQKRSIPACVARSIEDVRVALRAWGVITREAA